MSKVIRGGFLELRKVGNNYYDVFFQTKRLGIISYNRKNDNAKVIHYCEFQRDILQKLLPSIASLLS